MKWIHLGIIIQSLVYLGSAIPVITFQSNGTFSSETYLKRSGNMGEGIELNEMTVCLRLSVFYLRSRLTYFLSYANVESADAITGYFQRTKFDEPYM